jgi:hypothetical protein
MIIMICGAFTIAASGLGLDVVVINGLKDGQVWSPTYGPLPTHMVYESRSPHAFWTFIVFYLVGSLFIFFVAVMFLRELITEQRRRIADQKRRGGQ